MQVSEKNDNPISRYRRVIDSIDDKILNLLAERFLAVREIGKYKKEHNISIVDEKRIKEVMAKAKAAAIKNGFEDNSFNDIYETIIKSACIMESKLEEK